MIPQRCLNCKCREYRRPFIKFSVKEVGKEYHISSSFNFFKKIDVCASKQAFYKAMEWDINGIQYKDSINIGFCEKRHASRI